jgi:hypothetical protein
MCVYLQHTHTHVLMLLYYMAPVLYGSCIIWHVIPLLIKALKVLQYTHTHTKGALVYLVYKAKCVCVCVCVCVCKPKYVCVCVCDYLYI